MANWQAAETAARAAWEASVDAAFAAWQATEAAAWAVYQAAVDAATAAMNSTLATLQSQADQAWEDCNTDAAAVGTSCTALAQLYALLTVALVHDPLEGTLDRVGKNPRAGSIAGSSGGPLTPGDVRGAAAQAGREVIGRSAKAVAEAVVTRGVGKAIDGLKSAGKIKKAYNALNDHLTAKDLSGAKKKLRWFRSGKVIQHEKEVKEAMDSLRDAINAIKRDLSDPNLSREAREELEHHLGNLSRELDRVEGILGQ